MFWMWFKWFNLLTVRQGTWSENFVALRCCSPGSLRFPASALCPLISAFDGVCQDAHGGRGEGGHVQAV